MKKTLLGLAALFAVIILYMTTTGSAQATEALKVKVHQQIETLQNSGFNVEKGLIEEKHEHYVFTISEPEKISHYLLTQGLQADIEDIRALKGAKLAMDVAFLKDTYSVLSVDIYPLTLPDDLVNNTNPDDRKIIAQFEKMLKEKVFLVHVDFNKMLSGFKGYMKDINQTIEDKEKFTLLMQGITFTGDIEKEKINNIKQNIKTLSIVSDAGLKINAKEIHSNYSITGPSIYDSRSLYTVEELVMLLDDTPPMRMEGFQSTIEGNVTQGLAQGSIASTIKHISFTQLRTPYAFNAVEFNFNIKNLDVASLEALQKVDEDNTTEVQRLTQTLLSKGIEMQIPNFSVQTLSEGNKTMEGFSLNSSLKIKKNFDLNAVQSNPLSMLNSVEAETKIMISKELFDIIAKEPRAMIAMMLIPRIEENGKTVYRLELKEGKFTVNGVSF